MIKKTSSGFPGAHFPSDDAWQEFATEFAMASRDPRPRSKDELLGFLYFSVRRARQTKAQLMQDLWALWETNRKQGGYFVEFGAATGKYLSNTWLLEQEHGWTGILAEPNPDFHEELHRTRTCKVVHDCVYSTTGAKLNFIVAPMGELSRLTDIAPDDPHERMGSRQAEGTREIEVSTISLNELLDREGAPREIDFLSVDTEGSEFEILSNFDFSRWKVRLICVEHNFTPMREKLYDLLTSHGYRRKWPVFTRFDDWYILDEPAEPQPAIAAT